MIYYYTSFNAKQLSRVAAIQYFEGGYVVWNGIHAVAYQTGPGNSSATKVTPVEVRLHDLGMQYGRKEYGQYVGLSKRQDYYKFTVENLGDFYPHDLLFALRSNGVDIPLTDATLEILDAQMKPVPLSQVWQPNGQPGLSNLTGTTYYVRVKPAKDNLNYGLTLNLDSAQESLGTARPLGAIKGRRQFRDFVGNKGDGLGDYYSFVVEHPSLLHFSLSELEAGADANVELLDSNGNVVSLDSLSGKVGAKKLQPGSYYLRVNPANNTNTNYTLTMQMAEELGTYTGRHEYKDRIIGGKNREAYYRLNIDAPAEELHLALSNLSADAKVELLRDNGSGIVNSTLIFPVDGSTQSGTEAEYKGYANVQPGNYLVRVYLPNSSTQAAKYDLVMNLDQAGEDSSKTRDLGMLTDIAQLSDYQFSDFVGADKGDSGDVYKFQVGDYGLMHLALKPPAGDGEANMLAANMRLQDESGKDVTFLNPNKNSGENYAAAYLQPGKSYYLTVAPTPGMITNYNLVINPAQGGNDWASARDLGVIKDGQPNKADNEEDYKLQEFVGYLNGNVDGADFYKFTIDERNVMTFGLGGLSAPTHIQLFNAANPSKSINFSQLVYETPNLDKRLKVELNKGTYYLKLSPDESVGKKGTTYSLGINAEKVKTVVNSNTNYKLGSKFADSRIQKIYDVAFTKVKSQKENDAKNKIAVLAKDRKAINQQITEQLALLNSKQRTKIENELDKVEKDGKDWVEKYIAKPIKDGIDIVAKNTSGVIDKALGDWVDSLDGNLNIEKTLKDNVEAAQKWLEGTINDIRDKIDILIKEFVESLKKNYKTGAEINSEIEGLATTLKNNISLTLIDMNKWIDGVNEEIKNRLKPKDKLSEILFKKIAGVVEKIANDLTKEIKNKVSDVEKIAQKTVNAIKSFAQVAVAEISSKLLGDDTGKLYNQINGIDQQIIDIRAAVKKAISNEATDILNVVRKIEALLTDPEERNRMLDLLAKNGYNNVEEAHKFVVNNLKKIREQIAEEARKALELAKKNFADLVRKTVQSILGSNPKRQVNGNLRLDKIIQGAADIKAGLSYGLEQEEKKTKAGTTTTFYSVTTTPSLGIGISEGAKLETAWETGVQTGNFKIAGQNVETAFQGRVEGDIVLGTEIKYKFDSSNEDDMTRLGVWAFRELPTPFDSIDPILNTLIIQNFDSAEVFLNPSLTGEIVAPWGGGAINVSRKVAGGVKSNGRSYSKTELGLDSEGSIRGQGAGTELAKLGINVSGKLSFIAESSLGKLEKISIELEVPPIFADRLNFLIGGTPLHDKIKDFNSEVKEEGKAVGNVKFIIDINDPVSLLDSYSSVLMNNVLKLSQSKNESEFRGDLYETIGGVITAIKQTTNQSVEVKVNAEATQVVYLNAEAKIKIGGKIGLSNTFFRDKALYP